MPLKPQNIAQAAEADLKRRSRNLSEAEHESPSYEQYAFHRAHVRKARDVLELLTLALMHPDLGKTSAKDNTRMIYGDSQLLLSAARWLTQTGLP